MKATHINTSEQIALRKKYWEERKDDFTILLENWLHHEKMDLTIPVDTIYNEYLTTGINTFELSEYKYGKDLQKYFDEYLLASKNTKRKR